MSGYMNRAYLSNDPLIVAAQDLLRDRAVGATVRREGSKLFARFDEPVRLRDHEVRRYWMIPVPLDKHTER